MFGMYVAVDPGAGLEATGCTPEVAVGTAEALRATGLEQPEKKRANTIMNRNL
jgi:hypothetical protein